MSNPLVKKRTRAAWLFLAPAIVLITVFFVIPVAAGLLLSLTDFDLYAIGSPSVARFDSPDARARQPLNPRPRAVRIAAHADGDLTCADAVFS